MCLASRKKTFATESIQAKPRARQSSARKNGSASATVLAFSGTT